MNQILLPWQDDIAAPLSWKISERALCGIRTAGLCKWICVISYRYPSGKADRKYNAEPSHQLRANISKEQAGIYSRSELNWNSNWRKLPGGDPHLFPRATLFSSEYGTKSRQTLPCLGEPKRRIFQSTSKGDRDISHPPKKRHSKMEYMNKAKGKGPSLHVFAFFSWKK